MADYLLDLSANPLARKLVRQLRLPIPLPETLRRAEGAWEEKPLQGRRIAVASATPGSRGKPARLADLLARLARDAGATTLTDGAAPADDAEPLDALVFDATGCARPADLRAVYDFLHARVAHLSPGAQVVLVGEAPEARKDPIAAATAEALAGLVRSLAKELGRKGARAQGLLLAPGADDELRLAWPLRYLLSDRSAFVSGQLLRIGTDATAPEAVPLVAPLAGKTALVTGAAQGIGAAICRALAAGGAQVLGLDRPQEEAALTELMQELDGTPYLFDLALPDAARQIAGRIEAEHGHLDVLVNNAGITRDKTLARMPASWWDDVLAVNLQAAVALTDACVHGDGEIFKLMSPGGRVVMLSSIGGIAGNAGQTNYAAAKAGLIGYVRALAPQVARRGITVNAVAPGFIETRMTKAMPVAVREVARRFNSLSQAGVPADVAEAVLFLAAPGAFGLTGGVLRVCGQNLIGA